MCNNSGESCRLFPWTLGKGGLNNMLRGPWLLYSQECLAWQQLITVQHTRRITLTPLSPLVLLQLSPNDQCDSCRPASEVPEQTHWTWQICKKIRPELSHECMSPGVVFSKTCSDLTVMSYKQWVFIWCVSDKGTVPSKEVIELQSAAAFTPNRVR